MVRYPQPALCTPPPGVPRFPPKTLLNPQAHLMIPIVLSLMRWPGIPNFVLFKKCVLCARMRECTIFQNDEKAKKCATAPSTPNDSVPNPFAKSTFKAFLTPSQEKSWFDKIKTEHPPEIQRTVHRALIDSWVANGHRVLVRAVPYRVIGSHFYRDFFWSFL